MGSNSKGQLGLGTEQCHSNSPSLIEGLLSHQITNLSSGSFHSFAICHKKGAYSWGYGEQGQLGLGDSKDKFLPEKVKFESNKLTKVKVTKVECGPKHTMMLTEQMTVYCCGDNHFGQLGIPGKSVFNTPTLSRYLKNSVTDVACGTKHTLFLTGKSLILYFRKREGFCLWE